MSHIHRRKHTKIAKYSIEKPSVKDDNGAYYDIKKHYKVWNEKDQMFEYVVSYPGLYKIKGIDITDNNESDDYDGESDTEVRESFESDDIINMGDIHIVPFGVWRTPGVIAKHGRSIFRCKWCKQIKGGGRKDLVFRHMTNGCETYRKIAGKQMDQHPIGKPEWVGTCHDTRTAGNGQTTQKRKKRPGRKQKRD